jgi:predicted secreted protein
MAGAGWRTGDGGQIFKTTMKKFTLIVSISMLAAAAIAMSVAVSGCSKSARLPTTVTVVQEKDEPAKTANAVLGDTVVIEMPGNMTAGYMWTLLPLPADTAGLALVEGRYTPGNATDKDGKPVVGAPGKFTYLMRTVHVGEQKLEFMYHRASENGKPPEKTFTLTVMVK